ncbi:50S ribosomal protein L4 [Fastidiosipila sanguinis]|uniref:Large ribosomal subunit protein uL4 n=1 Tax=Fastidiosipila sanguinis TaxID=236753 RepID=A0A2S0KLN4_9FIRM|nr:50S ribosomal protein L4 [Fastidiosipila sanguinis]AVM41945.1 50S ribosomal protein L4 [Fastidiosipila sanguinis]
MAKVDVLNLAGKVVGNYELADSIYGIEAKEDLIYQVVKAQLANKRQGTSKVKNRSEVSGGGKKPWRQKGTGRARAGSIRAPQFIGGGVVFGPTPRSYKLSVPKKQRRIALKSVLSLKAQANNIYVLDEIALSEPKTKEIANFLKSLSNEGKALFVLEHDNKAAELSIRNLANANYAHFNTINVYDILNSDVLVLTKAAADKIEEVYA